MRSREELVPGEAKIEMFLSDLAVNGKVAASTQNQAFNALLFLYREVLHQPFENIQAVRANRPIRVPAVLTPDEVKQVIVAMSGLPQLVVKLLYGSGLRLLEALRLRVHDLDFEMKQLTVRDGKRAKDRFTVLSESLIPPARTFGKGKSDSPGGSSAGRRFGLSARCFGSQVSQGSTRVGLAIRIPGTRSFHRSTFWHSTPPPHRRGDHKQSNQVGGLTGGHRQTGLESRLSPQLRKSRSSARRRHSHHSGVTWPQ